MIKYKGTLISHGFSIGPAILIDNEDFSKLLNTDFTNIENEKNKLSLCIENVVKEIDKIIKNGNLTKEEIEILETDQIFLNDKNLQNGISELIHSYINLPRAIEKYFNNLSHEMLSKSSSYARERSDDYQTIKLYLLRALDNRSIMQELPKPEYPFIIVTKNLKTDMVTNIDKSKVLGIISESCSRTSHAAIIARSLGITAILNVTDATKNIKNGEIIFIDAEISSVCCDLNEQEINKANEKILKYKESEQLLEPFKDVNIDAKTKDNKILKIRGNIAHTDEIKKAKEEGVAGIGLMRSEFIFMDKTTEPTEDEQYEVYKYVLESFKNEKVVIRTIDIGGDKMIPYFKFSKEKNPFLGKRGIRFCLSEKETFKRQIRALLRSSLYGNLHIMIPMVSHLQEIQKTKEIIKECENELISEGFKIKKNTPLGIMIETPSSIMMANDFSKEVDFFSIGTNDLTQYICAADRLNDELTDIYNPLSPSVLRAIKMAIVAANNNNIDISICGELSSEGDVLPLLIGLGIKELSMNPFMVPITKKNALNISSDSAKELADRILLSKSLEEVKSHISNWNKEAL